MLIPTLPPASQSCHGVCMRKAFAHLLLNALAILAIGAFSSVQAAELTVYVEKNQFPKNETGQYTSIFPETINELIERTGTQAELVEISWQRGYYLGQTQRNAALIPTTRTPQREDLFAWLGPVNRLKWVFFKKKGREITLNSLDDARKVPSIGTYAKDAREQFLKDNGFRNLDSTNHQMLNVRKLMEGRIDLMVGTNLGINTIMKLSGFHIDEIEPAFTFKEVDLYIAFSLSSDPALLERWRKAFDEMKRDGTFQKMYERNFPGVPAPLVPEPQKANGG